MYVHSVNAVAWITLADPKQFAVSVPIQNRNFGAEVVQDRADNRLACLPLTHSFAGIFEASQEW
jgi:hypothetical protein